MSSRRLFLLAAGVVCLATLSARPTVAQPKAPPPPAKYDVEIYYRILAFRNQRARLVLALQKDLKALGFERDPDDEALGEDQNEVENVKVTRIKGTIPSANARKILSNPSVLTILLKPAGKELPAKDQPVRVNLGLASDLSPGRQQALAAELSTVLRKLGFRAAVGFDHRHFTRVVGSIPAGQLEALLRDVRRSPASWSLLPKSLLSDLRRHPDGPEVLKATLLQWNENAEGKLLVGGVVADWGLTKPAQDYLARFPQQVRRNREVVAELLLSHLQQHAEGAPLLEKLFDSVQKSPAAGELMDILLTRLETRPARAALPPLFQGARVLSLIEARPDLPLPAPRPEPEQVPPAEQKLSRPVRELLRNAEKSASLQRLEVILSRVPTADDRTLRQTLYDQVPSLSIEGRVGQVVTVQMKPAEATTLARLQLVSTIRRPRTADSSILRLSDDMGDPDQVLKRTGLDRLHKAGQRGQGVRVVVIDSDFRGWDKRLPKRTRLLDLTTERNDTLQPDALPAGEGLGSGVSLALAVLLAAPDCDLTLVRIDPSAPYMLDLLLRRVNGEDFVTESLVRRREDLGRSRVLLERRRQLLLKEREEVLKLFLDNRRPAPEDKSVIDRQKRREDYQKKEAAFKQEEKEFEDIVRAYLKYRNDLDDLKGVRVVVCGLAWNDGHPVDGSGALARYLDDTPLGPALWFQPSGNTRGQAWTGLVRDADSNGVMEFAEAKTPLPAGNLNHELNFLAWQPRATGERTATVPARTKVRVTMQWREAHDASFAGPGEDPYREPLAELRLVVLRQPDPEGKSRPADDFVLVAESTGLPQRVANEPSASTFEHVAEFTVDEASRYALRIEGTLPSGTEPRGAATLPATRQMGEIRPRLYVETLDGDGRVVLQSYATETGTLGTPGDALRALTVGAVTPSGQTRPYSTEGSPMNVELARKPDLRVDDRLGLEGAKKVGGTGLSAAFAAGHAAALLSGGKTPERVRQELSPTRQRGIR